MNVWSLVAAGLLVVVAVFHSVLGERYLLAPILRSMPAGPLGSTFARRTLRSAWHLTSVAWCGLAAIVLFDAGAVALDAAAVTMLVTAFGIGFGTRGAHFAWPLFACTAAMLALAAHGTAAIGSVRTILAVGLAGVLGALAALHVYWALGGRRGLASALPSTADGRAAFSPGAVATVGVAVALTLLGAVVLGAAGALDAPGDAAVYRFATALAGVVFVLRAIGDRRYCGFFKRTGGTTFARRDTALYTPLSVLLALACFTIVL